MTIYGSRRIAPALVIGMFTLGCGSTDSVTAVVNPLGSWHESFAGSASLDRTYGQGGKFREVDVLDTGKTEIGRAHV